MSELFSTIPQPPPSIMDPHIARLAEIERGLGDGAATTDDIRDLIEVVRYIALIVGAMESNARART